MSGSDSRSPYMPRIGLIIPALVGWKPPVPGEMDYPQMAELIHPSPKIRIEYSSFPIDAHREDALRIMGNVDRLIEAGHRLINHGVDSITYACTSGSFIFGGAGARLQAQELEKTLGIPVSNTSLAFIMSLRALNVNRVAIAATYPQNITLKFQHFLSDNGVGVVHSGCLGIIKGVDVGRLGHEAVRNLVVSNNHENSEAVLVPDTALRSIAWIEELETEIGKPVLTANQVTMWCALKLAGIDAPKSTRLGNLFRLSL